MSRIFRSLALLVPALLEGVGCISAGQAATKPLDPSLQASVCRNDWNQSIRAANQLIGNPTLSGTDRQQLIRFRHQLQDWRAAQARIANLPGCAGSPVAIDGPTVEFSASPPLNFEAAARSVQAMQALPSGYISIRFAAPQRAEAIDRSCRVVDATGRRIDLSFMCPN